MVLMPHLDFLSDDRFELYIKKESMSALLTGTPFSTGHHAIPLPCLPPLQ